MRPAGCPAEAVRSGGRPVGRSLFPAKRRDLLLKLSSLRSPLCRSLAISIKAEHRRAQPQRPTVYPRQTSALRECYALAGLRPSSIGLSPSNHVPGTKSSVVLTLGTLVLPVAPEQHLVLTTLALVPQQRLLQHSYRNCSPRGRVQDALWRRGEWAVLLNLGRAMR